MKRVQSLFALLLVSLSLSSCGEQWGGGLKILPWLTGIGAAIFLVAAIRSGWSGSIDTDPNTGRQTPSKANKGFMTPQFLFFVLLVLATIAIIWGVNYEK